MSEERSGMFFVIPKNYDYTAIAGGFPMRVALESLGGTLVFFQAFRILMERGYMSMSSTIFFQLWLCSFYLLICTIIYFRFGYSLSMFLLDLKSYDSEEKRYNIKRVTKRRR